MRTGIGNEDPYAEARYLAHRSLNGYKDQSVAWEALGNCDFAEGKWEEAIANFEKAVPYSKRPNLVRQKIALCRQRQAQEERR